MRLYRWSLVVLIAATWLIAGLPVLRARTAAEDRDRTVLLVADYEEFATLARSRNEDPAAFLRALRAVGVSGLGVRETTLRQLDDEGFLTELSGAELLDRARQGAVPPLPASAIDPLATYVFAVREPLGTWLGTALADRLGAGRVKRVGSVFMVSGDHAAVESQALGYRPGFLSALRALGFDIVLRPQNGPGLDAAAIRRYFAAAAAETPLTMVVFDGPDAMGYPHALSATARALRRRSLVLGAIETPTQLGNVDQNGIRVVDQAIGEHTVRLYGIPPWVLDQQPPSAVTTAVVQAVEDRHMRAIYLHPFTPTVDPARVLRANVQDYGEVAAALRRHGFQLGEPTPMPPLTVNRWQRLLLVLGVAASGLLLLSLLFPETRWGWLAVVGALALVLAAASSSLSREAAAITAAVVLPGLGIFAVGRLWQTLGLPRARDQRPGVWSAALRAALAAAGIAFVGALFVATLLGDTAHLLEWSFFRGVKLAYVGPPLIAIAAYIAYVEDGSFAEGLRRFVDRPVTLKHLVAGAVVLGAGALYLLRSGNVSAIPAVEARLRLALERLLVYRPREKEFLIGYPSIFLAALAAHRRRSGWFLVFLLGASAGLVSLTNSFEHLRTPFMTSFWRGVAGLGAGLVSGTVILALAAFLLAWWDRRSRAS